MAKLENVDSAKIGSSALTENKKKGSKNLGEITQKSGSVQVSLKKFPEDWYDIIKESSPMPVSVYIINAVQEKMIRDGIL